jgi:type IV secretory pathway VirB6-like protein
MLTRLLPPHYWLCILAGALALLLAGDAQAQVQPQVVVSLYGDDIKNCTAPGLSNMFSGFVCVYQQLVDELLSKLYFAMVDYFTQPFIAALTLFVITGGILFGAGMLPFTVKDAMMMLAKIAILSGFALYPELMIDILYNGVIGFMRQTVDTVVANLAPQGSLAGIFEWMDEKLKDFLDTQGAANASKNCDNDVLALLFGLAITMPPVFAIAVYILIQLIMVFIRTILGYLVAMTGIMFLTTLAPLFFGFALFRVTSSYFDQWLKYYIGFAMQIFIVFSFIAVVLTLPFEEKFQNVMEIVKPYDKVAVHDGQRLDFNKWCSLCLTNAAGSATTPDVCRGGDEGISPTNVMAGGVGGFINWVGQEIIILAVMAYLVEIVLKAAPNIAATIAVSASSTSSYTPGMSGGLPIIDNMANSTVAGTRAFGNSGNALAGSGNAFRAMTQSLLTGR